MNESTGKNRINPIENLLENTYGSKAYELVELFTKLDDIDRVKVVERINTLLEDDKYKKKRIIQRNDNIMVVDFS